MSQKPSLEPVSEKKEQWLKNVKFPCVHCNKVYKTRAELIAHYDDTRHDKY